MIVPVNFQDPNVTIAWLESVGRNKAEIIAVRTALRNWPIIQNAILSEFEFEENLILALRALSLCFVLSDQEIGEIKTNIIGDLQHGMHDLSSKFRGSIDSVFRSASVILFAIDATRNKKLSVKFAELCLRVSPTSYEDAAQAPTLSVMLSEKLWRQQPLWRGHMPDHIQKLWLSQKAKLLHENIGWEVWTDWYEARLRGDPFDPDLERARVLIDEAIWEQGPKAVNAEIARLIAARAAQAPQGERLELNPLTGRIGVIPPEVQDVAALSNACDKVSDALDDFRGSAVANRAYALNPVLRTLNRALSRYCDNARRLHDDFADAARAIAQEIEKDADLDERPVTALRDACALGAIDIRIAVREVSEFEAARRKRTARQPSPRSQTAARRLLGEIGGGLEPDLRDEMLEDVATVEGSQTRDTEIMPDSSARDAMLRSANRFAWLYRFAHLHPDRIAALATKASRAYDDVERLVTLISGAKEWWAVIEWIMRSL